MWRLASPYWSKQRERLIAAAAERALAGDAEDGDDPKAAMKGQWLNQWLEPQRRDDRRGEPLLAPGSFDQLRTDEDCARTRWTIVLEDHFGQGGAVAVCGELPSGGWLLAGWEFPSRAAAIARATELIEDLPRVELVAGASLLPDPDLAALTGRVTAATSVQTRLALPLLRELAAQRRVGWDPRDGIDIATAVERCRVVERQTGLVLTGPDRTDLIRAAAWALLFQSQPKPVPAIY